jgi:hypothetical protein
MVGSLKLSGCKAVLQPRRRPFRVKCSLSRISFEFTTAHDSGLSAAWMPPSGNIMGKRAGICNKSPHQRSWSDVWVTGSATVCAPATPPVPPTVGAAPSFERMPRAHGSRASSQPGGVKHAGTLAGAEPSAAIRYSQRWQVRALGGRPPKTGTLETSEIATLAANRVSAAREGAPRAASSQAASRDRCLLGSEIPPPECD